MSRAAFQLGRLTLLDNPMGMELQSLNLQTSRLPTSIVARQSESLTFLECPPGMGINASLPPSQEDGLCSGQGELGYTAATKELKLTVQHVNGTAELSDINNQAELLELIARRSGIKPANFSLWIGGRRIAWNCPLRDCGVKDGSTVQLRLQEAAQMN